MWWHIGLLDLDFLLQLASYLNCCLTFSESRWSCENHPWCFCSWWGLWLAPLLSLNSWTGLLAEIFCKAYSVHVRGLLWSGDAWFKATSCAMEMLPSLWIPFSNSCSLLLAVYVIIPQLIFSRSLCAAQCCALFSVRSSFWCLYSQVKAAAFWRTSEEHLQAWHLRAFSGRDLQRRIC